MLRSRVSGRALSLATVLVLFFAAPAARSDDAPPPDSGGQAPRGSDADAKMPEKSLMPKAEEGEVHDLDGPFALEYLKKMAGDWESEAGTVVASYHTTAGGTAVVETLFPGSDREMTSVYHLDGVDLVSTVYAPEGNQPRLKLDLKRSFAGKYFFLLSGGAGFDKSKDLHIHEKSLQFAGLDHINAEVILFEGRMRKDSEAIRLSRKKLP